MFHSEKKCPSPKMKEERNDDLPIATVNVDEKLMYLTDARIPLLVENPSFGVNKCSTNF
jgi:hypothetical protein